MGHAWGKLKLKYIKICLLYKTDIKIFLKGWFFMEYYYSTRMSNLEASAIREI